jgi:hypothetical protein
MLVIIPDIILEGESIYTAELWKPATLVTYVLFVFKLFAIQLTMGPVQWGYTCWQQLTS